MLTQRELRNDSAAVLREVEAGLTLIVTRNGTPACMAACSRRRARRGKQAGRVWLTC